MHSPQTEIRIIQNIPRPSRGPLILLIHTHFQSFSLEWQKNRTLFDCRRTATKGSDCESNDKSEDEHRGNERQRRAQRFACASVLPAGFLLAALHRFGILPLISCNKNRKKNHVSLLQMASMALVPYRKTLTSHLIKYNRSLFSWLGWWLSRGSRLNWITQLQHMNNSLA